MKFDITEYDREVSKEAYRIHRRHEHENEGQEDFSPTPAIPLIIAMLVRTGWQPDPDINEANKLLDEFDEKSDRELVMAALKRGRELERAESKPKMVWVKHNGSFKCPIDPNLTVWAKNNVTKMLSRAENFNWADVTEYLIVTN